MAEYLHPEAEKRFCNCGAWHGGHKGHAGWCNWIKVKPLMDACAEALNWFTPPNDSKPFPFKQIAEAMEHARGKRSDSVTP